MKDLNEIRQKIDKIDTKIAELFEMRLDLVSQVAEYKIAAGKPVLDRQREKEKLAKLCDMAESSFSQKGIKELFEQIMAMSRKKQYQLMAGRGIENLTEFKMPDRLSVENAKIVYQGVEGAYSQMAMKAFFGEEKKDGQGYQSYPVDTWRKAMEAIKSGEADFAVLPIENSSAGIVSENYDLLVEYDNCIVGEQVIKIEHALLGLPGTEMEDINCVYSHPQALLQCVDFLDSHREWERISLKNTAIAAKKIVDDGLKNQAAIANSVTAEIYGLQVLKETINYSEDNSTRFIIVAGKKISLKGADKISLCFEIPHESGSLYRILSHFIYNDLNLNKIESRPIKDKSFEYRFFVDFEGSLSDSAVSNALQGLKEEALHLKILGNY